MSARPRVPLAATVLAAGLGRRLGLRPKATLEIDGRSMLARLAAALREAGIEDISVVIGPYREALLPLAAACGLRVLAHPQPNTRLIDSQRLALEAHLLRVDHAVAATAVSDPRHHAGADLLLVVADLPLLAATHITQLRQAWRHVPESVEAMMPMVGGVRGHPVLLSRAAVEQILATPADRGVRDWLAAHPGAARPFPATDPAYVTDVDTPADIERLRTLLHPATVAWPTPAHAAGARPSAGL